MDQIQEENRVRWSYDAKVWASAIPGMAECALRLASSLNKGQACHFFREYNQGSYNICFYVCFPSTREKWVIRAAKTKALQYPLRAKLESEMATMQLIQKKTDIPIPGILSFSASKRDRKEGLYGFIVMPYMTGKPLGDALAEAQQRRSGLNSMEKLTLYKSIARYFVAIATIEFEHIGTLGFDSDSADEIGIVRGPQSQTLNSQQALGYRSFDVITSKRHCTHQGKFNSAREYASFLFKNLLNVWANAVPKNTDAFTEAETLFCFAETWRDIEMRFPAPASPNTSSNFISNANANRASEQEGPPFFIDHSDLNPGNILVDDSFNIVAVLDWEWAKVVPACMMTPPAWITDIESLGSPSLRSTGNNDTGFQQCAIDQVLDALEKEFRRKHNTSSGKKHNILRDAWKRYQTEDPLHALSPTILEDVDKMRQRIRFTILREYTLSAGAADVTGATITDAINTTPCAKVSGAHNNKNNSFSGRDNQANASNQTSVKHQKAAYLLSCEFTQGLRSRVSEFMSQDKERTQYIQKRMERRARGQRNWYHSWEEVDKVSKLVGFKDEF